MVDPEMDVAWRICAQVSRRDKSFIYSMQEADLAIAPLTLTAAREKVVAMTTPFMQTGISILLRRDISEETGFFDFLSPFTAQTWVGILAAYLGTAACIFMVTRFVVTEL